MIGGLSVQVMSEKYEVFCSETVTVNKGRMKRKKYEWMNKMGKEANRKIKKINNKYRDEE